MKIFTFIKLSIGILLAWSISLFAQVHYNWNGGTGDWHTAANWTPNGIPGITDTASVNSGKANVNTITNVAVLILNNGNVGGSDTLKINAKFEWRRGNMVNNGVTLLSAGAEANAGDDNHPSPSIQESPPSSS